MLVSCLYATLHKDLKGNIYSLGCLDSVDWNDGTVHGIIYDREPVSALISMVSHVHNSRLKSLSYCKPCKQQLGHPNMGGDTCIKEKV